MKVFNNIKPMKRLRQSRFSMISSSPCAFSDSERESETKSDQVKKQDSDFENS